MYLNRERGERKEERRKTLPSFFHPSPLFYLSSLIFLLFLAVGCSSNMTLQAMGHSAYYRSLAPDPFFANGQSARPAVPDTVARGHPQDDTLLFTGKINGQDANEFPFPITKDVLVRGQQEFNVYCAPCHDQTGSGNGMVVQRGFPAPPSYHSDRLRTAPLGHFFDVITNGLGVMPSYAQQVDVRDRWAIIAYIRALQLSEDATINDVPPDQRSKLGGP